MREKRIIKLSSIPTKITVISDDIFISGYRQQPFPLLNIGFRAGLKEEKIYTEVIPVRFSTAVAIYKESLKEGFELTFYRKGFEDNTDEIIFPTGKFGPKIKQIIRGNSSVRDVENRDITMFKWFCKEIEEGSIEKNGDSYFFTMNVKKVEI